MARYRRAPPGHSELPPCRVRVRRNKNCDRRNSRRPPPRLACRILSLQGPRNHPALKVPYGSRDSNPPNRQSEPAIEAQRRSWSSLRQHEWPFLFHPRGRLEYSCPIPPAIRRSLPAETILPDRETRGRTLKFCCSTGPPPTFPARLPCESVRLPSAECRTAARLASPDSASLAAPHRRPRATHVIQNCPAYQARHTLYGSAPE